jgi:phosphatidylserine decarboxylase
VSTDPSRAPDVRADPDRVRPGAGDRAFVALQRLLPKGALTRFAGVVARWRGGRATTAIIRWFVGRYGVAMDEAAEPDPAAYPTFNAFFTRALRDGARPLPADPDALVSPCDGAVSEAGALAGDALIQAKGVRYAAASLLGDAGDADAFAGGAFATLYLSPKDYHRVHVPTDGRLVAQRYVPGDLYSVNPSTARGVPGLFARNERLVCVFEGSAGRWALVLVGALIVGGIRTVWGGPVTRGRGAPVDLPVPDVQLARGDELGAFELGSTVVLLFEPGRVDLSPALTVGAPVTCRAAMGRVVSDASR